MAEDTNQVNGTSNVKVEEKKKQPLSKRPAFKARMSRLDTEIVNTEHFSLRGFFTAFWIALFLYSIHTVYRSWKIWKTKGSIRLQLFNHMFQDGSGLFISDMVLIFSCFGSLLIVKLMVKRWIPLKLTTFIQHIWQSTWFGSCIFWAVYRDWPWTQSGCFTLHAIAMLLKQHSYLSTNIEMEHKLRKLQDKTIQKEKLESNKKKKDQEYSDSDLKQRQQEIKVLEGEITTEKTRYPTNVSVYNFVDYMLVPTLVYDLQYPRTEKFRFSYFMEKVAGILSAFFLLYLTVEHYIMPVIQEITGMSFMDVLMGLLMPFMVCYFMVFYIIFEGICNAFAELTLFADRDFYSDWWNSCSFDEFARKWNRPVHEFLLRHVYLESLETYKLSKENATFLTFFLSSCLHELVVAVVGKRIRFWLFFFQMSQLPLIYFARIPFIKKRKLIGNIIFWIGMLLGPPLITTLYVREYFMEEAN